MLGEKEEEEEERKAAVAFYLQEQDDAVLCAFGRDYFDGARRGAACGGVFTAWLSRRTYVDLRDDFKKYEADLPRHLRRGKWTISRGFRTRPFLTLGCISLVLTTLMKSVKFTLANHRYQEFLADDIGFTLLEQMYANLPEGNERLEKFLDEALTNSRTASASSTDGVSNSRMPHTKTVTSTLLQETSPLCERKPPSFWDGVAVGLMGSIMDCYLPSKPVYNYYGMRCGMRI
ncbi:hypothetical protein MOQ_008565 [Trypanosoma cruzi marinkellei]|uniref:Uncharacterized protein n=1 Tax=Trypanosoma cruzi marinkellei TaxID=85056 RepID=K2MPZ6_TRYCR|nr:hypothetical protein MOQ_008565 [Trypanosoma cruzi marinkellei]